MLKANLDSDGFWTGEYVDMPDSKEIEVPVEIENEDGTISVGLQKQTVELPIADLSNSVVVDTIPDETDLLKQQCYKFEDEKLVFNEEKYNSLLVAQEAERKKQEVKTQIKQLQSDIEDIDAKIVECANYKLLELDLPYDPKILLSDKTDKQNQISELELQLS